MIRSHDIRCNPDECLGLIVCDTIRLNHERLVEVRANRAAEFFDAARAARDDIASGAYPSLGPTVRTPIFSNGVLVGHAYGRIVANLAPSVRINPPYLVELHNSGVRVGAFSRELELA